MAVDALVAGLRPMVADAGRPVLLTDLEGRVLLASAELGRRLGVDPGALAGEPLYDTGPDGSPTDVPMLVTGLLTNGRGAAASRARLRSATGDALPVSLHFSLVRGEEGLPAGLLVEVEDDPDAAVAGPVALDARPDRLGGLTGMADAGTVVPDPDARPSPLPTRGTDGEPTTPPDTTGPVTPGPGGDALTGLPDRAMLLEHLDHTLARTGEAVAVAVAFLDLDRFKRVNDTHGHEAGDRLLQLVADRLRRVLRPSDLVARLGGDEFVVVCDGVRDEHHAREIMDRITATVSDDPFDVGETRLEITASGGIALSVEHRDAERLLREADEAMYRSKRLGRGRLEVYDDDMRAATTHRRQLADDLAGGLDAGEIRVHYQPVYDLATRRPVAVEALARWRHPERGLVDPAEFIAIAEDTGLVVQLGLAVLHQACNEASRWAGRGHPLPVHVNLSTRQMAHVNLPLLVESILEAALLPADLLCVELTEATVMDDESISRENLAALCALGCGLVIDDFGSGVSSVGRIANLPVRALKIDRSFVERLDRPEERGTARAVIAFATALGITPIAEGVETEGQSEQLLELGCAAGQGFHLARPMGAEAIGDLLRAAAPLDRD